MNEIECLVDIYKITEYRDDAVYQTELVNRSWIDLNDYNNPPEGFVYNGVSIIGINSFRLKMHVH